MGINIGTLAKDGILYITIIGTLFSNNNVKRWPQTLPQSRRFLQDMHSFHKLKKGNGRKEERQTKN
jgi:hypothetical protein